MNARPFPVASRRLAALHRHDAPGAPGAHLVVFAPPNGKTMETGSHVAATHGLHTLDAAACRRAQGARLSVKHRAGRCRATYRAANAPRRPSREDLDAA